MPGAPPPMMTMPPLDSQGAKTKYANGESNVAQSGFLIVCCHLDPLKNSSRAGVVQIVSETLIKLSVT